MGKKLAVVGIVVYLLSFGLAYLAFTRFGVGGAIVVAPPTLDEEGRLTFSGPATQVCPINGAKYSKQQESWWEDHRPLGVMIENHTEARPQSGLSYADVVYEALAEGGITRFLAIYECQDAGTIGPVRSARVYFLNYISEYGEYPLYAHVGGANCNAATGDGCANGAKADALGFIDKWGWKFYNDLDQMGFDDLTYKRIQGKLTTADGGPVATEHTMYTTTQGIWDYAKEKRDIAYEDADGNAWDEDFVMWKFADDPKESARPKSQTIAYDFGSGPDFAVKWTYDPITNTYIRSNGGEKHIDLETKKALAFKNVVVLFMDVSPANDGYTGGTHLLYDNIGSGEALVFQNGKEIEATWTKADRASRLKLEDEDGNEITFTRGPIWFSLLETGSDVSTN